jgi:hypothetical protein
MQTFSKVLIGTAVAGIVLASVAHADFIDEQIVRETASVERAEVRLARWTECAANRDECQADLVADAERRVESALRRLEAVTPVSE